MVIWKVALKPIRLQEVDLPAGAEILFAAAQYNRPCIWFKCDPSQMPTPRTIALSGTGHEAAEGRYLGSAVLDNGARVLHIFEPKGN